MFLFPGLISLVDGYRVLPGFSEGPIASADLFPRFTEFLRNLVAKLFVFDVVYRVLPGFPKVLRLRVYRVSFKRLASLVDDYRVLPGFSFPRVLRIRVFTEFFFFGYRVSLWNGGAARRIPTRLANAFKQPRRLFVFDVASSC